MVPPWVYTHCHDDATIVKSYPYALESRAGLSVLHTHQFRDEINVGKALASWMKNQ